MIGCRILLFTIIVSGISSCATNYHAFKDRYGFRSRNGGPDYGDLNYWAAHPWKWDPSDSIPAPLKKQTRDSLVDVFFLHPTIYTMKKKKWGMNAPVDDDYLNAKTDYSTILYQASIFNQHARVFAPRFREAHLSAYFTRDTSAASKAFDLAYGDIKSSFEFYMQHFNQGRPIIIASHSQGSTHALHLLKDYFENKPLQKQLVVAYVAGMTIPADYFIDLKPCADSLQTGCFCGWRTFREGYLTPYVKRESPPSLVVNPLTWRTDEEPASRQLNAGSVLFKFNKIYRATTGARIHEGVIWVRKPRFPWSFLYFKRNYHVGDFNLFYMSLRKNVETRISAYFKESSTN